MNPNRSLTSRRAAGAFAGLATLNHAAEPLSAPADSLSCALNVRDFGAKGDSTTDGTVSFEETKENPFPARNGSDQDIVRFRGRALYTHSQQAGNHEPGVHLVGSSATPLGLGAGRFGACYKQAVPTRLGQPRPSPQRPHLPQAQTAWGWCPGSSFTKRRSAFCPGWLRACPLDISLRSNSPHRPLCYLDPRDDALCPQGLRSAALADAVKKGLGS